MNSWNEYEYQEIEINLHELRCMPRKWQKQSQKMHVSIYPMEKDGHITVWSNCTIFSIFGPEQQKQQQKKVYIICLYASRMKGPFLMGSNWTDWPQLSRWAPTEIKLVATRSVANIIPMFVCVCDTKPERCVSKRPRCQAHKLFMPYMKCIAVVVVVGWLVLIVARHHFVYYFSIFTYIV